MFALVTNMTDWVRCTSAEYRLLSPAGELPPVRTSPAPFQRWDLDVNLREEKTILGAGQAQVRAGLGLDNQGMQPGEIGSVGL